MRIGVDARHLGEGRGVARYTSETLAALAAGFPGDRFVLFIPGRQPVALPAGDFDVRRSALGGRVVFGAGAALRRPRLERLIGDVDAVWLPAPAPLALGGDVPYVLTMHDLSFVTRPADFTAYERLWHRAGRLRDLAAEAARIICVSAATARELESRWAIGRDRIDVVAPGVWTRSAAGAGAGAESTVTPSADPYLLFVGALEPRKAPEVLGEAFSLARGRGLRAELVVAGDGRMRGALDRRDGVRMLGAVDAAVVDPLYRGALAVVLPSRLEGFGLPPLEGLARGVPAIVSDLAVYDETLGEGAMRVPAGDAGALADAFLRVEGDPMLRAQLVTAGQAAIAPLTWEACAAGVRASLERAVGA